MNDDRAISHPCDLGPFPPSIPISLKGRPTRFAAIIEGETVRIIGVASGSRVAVFREQGEKAA